MFKILKNVIITYGFEISSNKSRKFTLPFTLIICLIDLILSSTLNSLLVTLVLSGSSNLFLFKNSSKADNKSSNVMSLFNSLFSLNSFRFSGNFV